MNGRYWDINTFVFYVIISIFIGIAYNFNLKKNNKKINLGLLLIYLGLVFIASYRFVGNNIGGIDAEYYIHYFQHSDFIKFSINDIIHLQGNEFVFYNLLTLIGKIVDNYHILFMLLYGFMVFVFLKIFKINNGKKLLAITAPLLVICYLKSFNLLRNYLAICVVYLAIEELKNKRDIRYLILIAVATLIHYTSIVFFAFYVFQKIFVEKRITKKWLVIIDIVSFIILSISCCAVFKNLLSNTGYNGYINSDYSFWGYIPSFILLLLTLMYHKSISKELIDNNSLIYYKLFLFYIILLPMMTIIGGGSRWSINFELDRIILWGYVLKAVYEHCKRSNKKMAVLFEIIFILIMMLWILYSIHRIWYTYGIMPYLFNFSNLEM